jgi:NTP pyrophosphatase (non-canonical NTP hydrolase)
MNFSEYQKLAADTAIYPKESGMEYCVLGLFGECGEIAQKFKRVIRGDEAVKINEIALELGDCLWYISQLASELEIDLGAIAITNLTKCHNRKQNGTLKGSGDDR